ncbi:MAG TPA: glycosyltransferase, partial [Acidimicrobiales bacterium]|nr:glycosyltransferase [Acidimicrobiales bacterium]
MRIAVLSLHTSPLAQPGTGDGGGMNVYVRELCGALARAGVECDVYTRTWHDGLAPVVAVEPGFRVHHVDAGPRTPLGIDDLVVLVDEFTDGVRTHLQGAWRPDLIHANYWLSGLSGHVLKHQLELPLVSTFHTLARVKAENDADHHGVRARAEAEIIGCSDAILALSHDEGAQLERLYHAVPERIEIVPPGVDHRLFSPGDKIEARAALGLELDFDPHGAPLLLFVGRIQPLKGADVAVRTLAELPHEGATLVIVGGPSGPDGESELRRLHRLVDDLGLHDR